MRSGLRPCPGTLCFDRQSVVGKENADLIGRFVHTSDGNINDDVSDPKFLNNDLSDRFVYSPPHFLDRRMMC